LGNEDPADDGFVQGRLLSRQRIRGGERDREGQQRCGDTLAQVRRIDPSFEAAEWEMTLAPSARGTGAFVDAARLIGSFAFESVGASRLESRVMLQNGRANGAFRKVGAVQEGVLQLLCSEEVG